MSTTKKMQARARLMKKMACAKNKSIYHYTKGLHICKIVKDGFIHLERNCNTANAVHMTNFVWLTEKETFPKTALPYIASMPETFLPSHFADVKPNIDWDMLSAHLGGVYRFKFNSLDTRFKSWFYCNYRAARSNSVKLKMLEETANMAGDNVKKFWIAEQAVCLKNCALEQLINGTWVQLFVFDESGLIKETSHFSIEQIVQISSIKRVEFGLA